MTDVFDLREKLTRVLSPYLGEYERADGSKIPAVWVWDRPFPDTYKMLVMPTTKPMIPAIELAIEPEPNPNVLRGGFRRFVDWRSFTVRLIQHDRRQRVDPAINLILVNYSKTKTPLKLPGTDFSALQYVFEVVAPVQYCPT